MLSHLKFTFQFAQICENVRFLEEKSLNPALLDTEWLEQDLDLDFEIGLMESFCGTLYFINIYGKIQY